MLFKKQLGRPYTTNVKSPKFPSVGDFNPSLEIGIYIPDSIAGGVRKYPRGRRGGEEGKGRWVKESQPILCV